MRYDSAASRALDWRLKQYETSAGNRPFEDELAGISGTGELARMVRAIEQLAVAGLPPDPRALTAVVEKVKRKGWRGPTLWYLHPNGCSYRAYVAPWPERCLMFLHLIEKRGWKRPRGSDDRAFSRLAELVSGAGRPADLVLRSR